MTPIAKKVLGAIADYTREVGYPPTIRELATLFKYRSTNTVAFHLDNLRRDGLLTRTNTHRSTRLTMAGRAALRDGEWRSEVRP
jgi:repressor LexA